MRTLSLLAAIALYAAGAAAVGADATKALRGAAAAADKQGAGDWNPGVGSPFLPRVNG